MLRQHCVKACLGDDDVLLVDLLEDYVEAGPDGSDFMETMIPVLELVKPPAGWIRNSQLVAASLLIFLTLLILRRRLAQELRSSVLPHSSN